MPHDEAAAVIGPPCHLRLLPDPPPEQRAAHLRVLILNATDTFGAESKEVEDLKAKFDSAMRAVVAARPK